MWKGFSSLYPKTTSLIKGACAGLCSTVVVFALSNMIIFQTMEAKSWDWRLKHLTRAQPTGENVVVLHVDQGSLDAMGREGVGWPWFRSIYKHVLDFTERGGAKAVVFDILFTEPSIWTEFTDDDRLFSKELRRHKKVFMGTLFSTNRETGEADAPRLDPFAIDVRNNSRASVPIARSVRPPIKEILEAIHGVGNTIQVPDPDGVYRKASLLTLYEDKYYPSLPFAVATDFLGDRSIEITPGYELEIGEKRIPLAPDGKMLIHYYGPPLTMESYPIAKVIKAQLQFEAGEPQEIDPSVVRDKVVFVGYSAPGLFDNHPTPFSPVNPGVEVNATVLNNILENDFYRRGSFVATLFLTVIPSILVATLVFASPAILRSLLPLLAIMIFIFLAAWIGFIQKVWVDLVAPTAATFFSFATAALVSYNTEGRRRRQIKFAFQRYVAEPVVEELLKDPGKLKLGGERKEITALFSDIGGFTSLTEKTRPEEVVDLLNEYLDRMTEQILYYKGTLDKYMGDGIMAFWGAPLPQEDHARNACYAALECRIELVRLNEKLRERGLPELQARIGINSGDMIVGNVGSKKRFDYTILGDNVNLSSRLEGVNKFYGTEIIISENTYQLASGAFDVRELDVIRVKGKENPVRIYQLLGRCGEIGPDTKKAVERFHQGLRLYRERRWMHSLELFRETLGLLPGDMPSSLYVQRCLDYQDSPPGNDWDGSFTMETK